MKANQLKARDLVARPGPISAAERGWAISETFVRLYGQEAIDLERMAAATHVPPAILARAALLPVVKKFKQTGRIVLPLNSLRR